MRGFSVKTPADSPSYIVGLFDLLKGSRPTHADTRAGAETEEDQSVTGAVEIKAENTETRDGGTLSQP